MRPINVTYAVLSGRFGMGVSPTEYSIRRPIEMHVKAADEVGAVGLAEGGFVAPGVVNFVNSLGEGWGGGSKPIVAALYTHVEPIGSIRAVVRCKMEKSIRTYGYYPVSSFGLVGCVVVVRVRYSLAKYEFPQHQCSIP